MNALRILDGVVWFALLVYMTPGAWAASFGKGARWGDPMRLGVWTTALLFVAFSLWWLMIPDQPAVYRALMVLSAADAIYIAKLAYTYGRGAKL